MRWSIVTTVAAVMVRARATPTPNSEVTYFAQPLEVVSGSKRPWIKVLCVACRRTHGQTLPERNLRYPMTYARATTITVKHAIAKSGFVPEL